MVPTIRLRDRLRLFVQTGILTSCHHQCKLKTELFVRTTVGTRNRIHFGCIRAYEIGHEPTIGYYNQMEFGGALRGSIRAISRVCTKSLRDHVGNPDALECVQENSQMR